MRTRIHKMTLALLVLGLLVTAGATSVFADDGPQFTVAVDALNLRGGPGTGYAVLDVLRSGASGTVTGRDATGTWYQVKLPDGKTGWVYGEFVQVSGDASKAPVVAAPAAALPATQPVARSAGNLMVFQTSSGGKIYAVDVDAQGNLLSGAFPRYLTTGMDPAISPDGKSVAFTRWSGSGSGAAGEL